MQAPIRLGICGASGASIEDFIEAAKADPGVVLKAIAIEDPATASSLAQAHGFEKALTSFEDAIRSPELDAVYLSLGGGRHDDLAVGFMEHRKHVLCAKPLASSAAQVRYMMDCAKGFGRILMPAYPSRHHPVLQRALEIQRSGAIGRVVRIDAVLEGVPGQGGASGAWIAADHGVGWCRLFTGEEPRIDAVQRSPMHDDPNGRLVIEMTFPGGASARVVCACGSTYRSSLIIVGERGRLEIADPFKPELNPELVVEIDSQHSQERLSAEPAMSFQLNAFVAKIVEGADHPIEADDAIRQMEVMDRCCSTSIGVLERSAKLTRLWLSETDVVARLWRFGRESATPYARHLTLLPGGRIGGHFADAERRWLLEDGVLVFLDDRGRRSHVFDEINVGADGLLVLVSCMAAAGSDAPCHVLNEIEPIGELSLDTVDLTMTPTSRRRANLVVLGASQRSLHSQWPRDIGDRDRSWDLCLNWYGDRDALAEEPVGEYRALQDGLGKYRSIYRLFHRSSPLWAYDYIMLLDDDLLLSWSDLNSVFEVCREYGLQIAQPSLDEKGVAVHPITRHRSEFLLRYTSFVESMAPVFARDALKVCMPTFRWPSSGFGIDNIWPKLIGEPRNGVAIIDKVKIVHTRPIGTNYSLARAVGEGNEVQRRYDAPSRLVEYGAIYAKPEAPRTP